MELYMLVTVLWDWTGLGKELAEQTKSIYHKDAIDVILRRTCKKNE